MSIHLLFDTVPWFILLACVGMVVYAFAKGGKLWATCRDLSSKLDSAAAALRGNEPMSNETRRRGLSLSKLTSLRSVCEEQTGQPREWWERLDEAIEEYAGGNERDGWFLTERPREILPYDEIISRRVNLAEFHAIPGMLTAFGLALTFVAILLALLDVRYDEGNAENPVSGLQGLINGLSGKFISSILALALSIAFTFWERNLADRLRSKYECLLSAISNAIPYLPKSSVLIDIQKLMAKQTVSVSHISTEVVDRFVGAFNERIVPDLAESMASGVAESMQEDFRPTMERMTDTLSALQNAIVALESQKQETVTGEIKGLLESLERSLVQSLSKMGSDFHEALTGAASREFGNVQGTLEATRHMLSEMNSQFSKMHEAFSSVITKAEQSTSDQLKIGKEQTEALAALMNGLMLKIQETADQNLSSVRSHLTRVVGELSERVGALSEEMMRTAENFATQSHTSATQLLEQTGHWSEATAERLETLLSRMEAQTTDFREAGRTLLDARSFITDLLDQNAISLARMSEASQHVQTYTMGLAGQTKVLLETMEQQRTLSSDFLQASTNIRELFAQHELLLSEYKGIFQDYQMVFDELDQNLSNILGTLDSGLRNYNQSMENNFREIVKIANETVPTISGVISAQMESLSGQLDELGNVISTAMERIHGRTQ
jgi:hypothetical protein